MSRYDLVVIGGGPAGEKAAVAAAYFGKRVALVDDSTDGPGGAAVHTGTLPSKTLRESALYLTGFRKRELSDLLRERVRSEAGSATTLVGRLAAIRQTQTAQIDANLARHGVEPVAIKA